MSMKPRKLKTYTIEVRPSHIRGGMRGSKSCCPVARALRELGFMFILVFPGEIRIDGQAIPTTRKLAKFIADFDFLGAARPTKFRLRLPALP